MNNWIHILVSDPKRTVSDVLKQTVVPLFEQSDCKSKLGSAYDESFICAGGQKGEDACEGDGGGPLVCSLTNSRDEQYVQVSFDQISHNFLLQICCRMSKFSYMLYVEETDKWGLDQRDLRKKTCSDGIHVRIDTIFWAHCFFHFIIH